MKRPSRHAWAPPVAAIAVAAVVVAAWSTWRSASPRADRIPAPPSAALVWVAPGVGPLQVAPLEPEAPPRTLVVGDSRVGAGIDPAHLDATFPAAAPSAIAWAHGARTSDLLAAPIVQRAERVVVHLSPLGLRGLTNPIVAALLRLDDEGRPPAPLRPEATAAELERWAESERARLVDEGLPAPFVNQAIEWWIQETVGAHTTSRTARIDAALGRSVGHARRWWVQPIWPARWHSEWLPTQEPDGSLADYRRHLGKVPPAQLEEAARELSNRLAALAASSVEVTCVRLPVSPEQRALEDTFVPPERLAAAASDAGVPYLDLGAWPDATSDGSHLAWDAARRATERIGEWLRAGAE